MFGSIEPRASLTGIQHGQIQQLSNLEVPPDPKLVVRVDLPDGQPLVIRTDSSKLPIREAGLRFRERAAGARIVAVRRPCLPGLICHLHAKPVHLVAYLCRLYGKTDC